MDTQPLVSVIIPTYNRAHLIGETLDSVLAQTYQNWECIIVDDGSSDNTDEVVGEYVQKDPRFKYYHRPEEHLPGGNGARNFGFKMSQGEYIQWFDSDDLMIEDFIEQKIEVFEVTINFVISGGYYLFLDGTSQNIEVILRGNLFKQYVLWKVNLFTSSVMFRRDFLGAKLLFNESILKGQESDFFSRLFYQSNEFEYKIINVPLFYYRRHDETKSELDKNYKAEFKYSTARNHLSNLERALEQKDLELVKYFYKKSLKSMHKAVINSDKKTSSLILKKFKQLLLPQNRILYIKIKFFVQIGRVNKKLNKKLFNHLKYSLFKV